MNRISDDHVGPVEWEVVEKSADGLHALHGLFEEHDYVEVVRGCEEILRKDPRNKSAKKLKWMAKKRLAHHEVKLGVAVMGMALMVVVGSMSFMNKRILGDLQTKDVQVNSLIEELGDLREENLLLYRKLENNFQDLNVVKTSVLDLEKILPEEALTLQSKLNDVREELASKSEAVEKLVSAGVDHTPTALIASGDTLDVLILGTHGSLTDTILLASINPLKETVSLFSIPRDLAINGRRINEYYARFGIDAMRTQIEEITGLYPEKYVVVDLEAFSSVVDALGGIDVDVPVALYDANYPAPNFKYQTFSVQAGLHHFNGSTALKYARSRKSTSDFDRAARQQLIIEAVYGKIKSLDLLDNMDELVGMASEVIEQLETDVDLLDFVVYSKRFQDFEIERGNVLSTGNYLYSMMSPQGAYLLLPKDGTYAEIRTYIAKEVRG